jgi:hypothetical protein
MGKVETYGPKFQFLASIYRFVCGYILRIVHKWNLSVWSYKMSGETFWSGVWFSHKFEGFENGMQKPKLET